ncbi:ABC transporter substrate-binding protein, partial [bacterium]|nr:ABC transporter substrate-binding protein [bacterium]
WDKGQELLLVPNENYWQGASKVQISYTFYSQEAQRLLDFQNGKLDILPSISHTNRERFLFDKNSEVRLTPAIATFFLGFNSESVKVTTTHRRAIRHALDREKLVYTGSRGGGLPAHSILPPVFGFALEDTAAYRPEYARKLLEKSNFDFSQKLLLVRYRHTPREIIDLKGIASYLAKIGVQVDYQLIPDWTEYNNLLSSGVADLFLDGGTSTYAAPDEFLTSLFYSTGPFNLFHYSNPQVDSMLDQAQQLALEPARQTQLYQKVLYQVAQDVPCIPISHSSYVHVIRGRLKGLKINPLGFMNFQHLSSGE